jgi:hypothetical protein
MHYIFESIIVGIVIGIVGICVYIAETQMYGRCLPSVKKLSGLFINLFITGALSHILLEIVGGNNWYCYRGHACNIEPGARLSFWKLLFK